MVLKCPIWVLKRLIWAPKWRVWVSKWLILVPKWSVRVPKWPIWIQNGDLFLKLKSIGDGGGGVRGTVDGARKGMSKTTLL